MTEQCGALEHRTVIFLHERCARAHVRVLRIEQETCAYAHALQFSDDEHELKHMLTGPQLALHGDQSLHGVARHIGLGVTPHTSCSPVHSSVALSSTDAQPAARARVSSTKLRVLRGVLNWAHVRGMPLTVISRPDRM